MYFPALYQSGSPGRRGVRGGTMNITKLGEDSLPPHSRSSRSRTVSRPQ